MLCRIAIIDDSSVDTSYIASLVNTWAELSDTSVQVTTFFSAEAFLFTYAENRIFDILLLDIEMDGMNGIELAQKLRREGADIQLVFITGYPDFISKGYDVAALHYLMKPVLQEKLAQVLDRAVENLMKTRRSIVLSAGGVTFRLAVDDIQYVEAFSHSLSVVTGERTYQVRMPLSEIENKLGEGFVRCHRSYLVGLRFLAQISKNNIILDSGKMLPVSRGAASAVHKAFIDYYSGGHHETF